MMNHKIRLSELARNDISQILAYTHRKYGGKQRIIYKDLLFGAIETIAGHPAQGHIRPDIPAIYRAFNCGQHVVVYTVRDNVIFIARVLHGSMDFPSQKL